MKTANMPIMIISANTCIELTSDPLLELVLKISDDE